MTLAAEGYDLAALPPPFTTHWHPSWQCARFPALADHNARRAAGWGWTITHTPEMRCTIAPRFCPAFREPGSATVWVPGWCLDLEVAVERLHRGWRTSNPVIFRRLHDDPAARLALVAAARLIAPTSDPLHPEGTPLARVALAWWCGVDLRLT